MDNTGILTWDFTGWEQEVSPANRQKNPESRWRMCLCQKLLLGQDEDSELTTRFGNVEAPGDTEESVSRSKILLKEQF